MEEEEEVVVVAAEEATAEEAVEVTEEEEGLDPDLDRHKGILNNRFTKHVPVRE